MNNNDKMKKQSDIHTDEESEQNQKEEKINEFYSKLDEKQKIVFDIIYKNEKDNYDIADYLYLVKRIINKSVKRLKQCKCGKYFLAKRAGHYICYECFQSKKVDSGQIKK